MGGGGGGGGGGVLSPSWGDTRSTLSLKNTWLSVENAVARALLAFQILTQTA